MGKVTGFKEYPRSIVPYRAENERLADFDEIFSQADPEHLQTQGARCMDCGVPFCQSEDGCPVDNLIPEWNDLVFRMSGVQHLIVCMPPIIFRSSRAEYAPRPVREHVFSGSQSLR